ncbi:plasmid pRiA4b ORF-3 family protein, partial [Planctomycetota bacterium]
MLQSQDIDDLDMHDEKEYRLKKLVNEGDIFEYLYDFGDCWEHEVLVEKLIEPGEGIIYPICLAGERSCPPEDCGGPWGYADLLRMLDDPGHEEY